MKKLEHKTAVITGGGSGIGAAIAKLFAEHGASVAILDRNEQAGGHVIDALRQMGASAHFEHADVAQSDSVREAIDAAATNLGGIDILVTAAGILAEKPMREMTEDDFDQTLDIDLKGVF